MKIELTDQEIFILSEALGRMPYSSVVQLVSNIQTQINAQKKEDGNRTDS